MAFSCARLIRFLGPAILALAWVSAVALAGAQFPIGIYSGSFDPPHAGHEEVIRRVLQETPVKKLYIIVNAFSAEKDFKASQFERHLLVSKMVAQFGDRVEVIDGPYFEPEQMTGQIARKASGPAYRVVGSDRAIDLAESGLAPSARSTRIRWIVTTRAGTDTTPVENSPNVQILKTLESGYSSTKLRQDLGQRKRNLSGLPFSVRSIVDEQELYSIPQGAALTTRRNAFAGAYKRFREELKAAFPNVRAPRSPPPFIPQQSVHAWQDHFFRSVLSLRSSTTKGTGRLVAWHVARTKDLWLAPPPQLVDWLDNELRLNDRVMDSSFSPLDEEGKLSGKYNTKTHRNFEAGYIEVPIEDAWNAGADELTAEERALLIFERDGQTFQRHFIDPEMEGSLAGVIKRYGGLKKGEFAGSRTASPRSLMVWKVGSTRFASGVKVSLLDKIGGVSRVNHTTKLSRSRAINGAVAQISAQDQKQFGFKILLEPMQAQTPRRPYGNIVRRLGRDFFDPSKQVIPGFSSLAKRRGSPPLIVEWILGSGLAPEEYLREKVIRPMIRPFLYLALKQGLIGEPHQQNMTWVRKLGKLLKVFYRDLDAFRTDPEMRALNGRDLTPYLEAEKPFGRLKLREGARFYDESYIYFIKNTWSFAIEHALGDHAHKLGLDTYLVDHRIWTEFDRVLLEESAALVGSQAALGDLTRFAARNRSEIDRLFPGVDWAKPRLSMTDLRKLLNSFPLAEITGIDQSSYRTPVVSLQGVAERVKAELRLNRPAPHPAQALLRSEYLRLQANGRALSPRVPPGNAVFDLNRGAILARTANGKSIGIALPEPKAADASFYKKARGPPPLANHKKLWTEMERLVCGPRFSSLR